MAWVNWLQVQINIEVYGVVGFFPEVHVTIGPRVVDLKGIIIVDLVVLVLVAAMRGDFENELR